MENLKQTIKCDVINCKYNDVAKYLCLLEKIDISCTCSKKNCHTRTETICKSFQEKI